MKRTILTLLTLSVFLASNRSQAATFANKVISYIPGTSASLTDPDSALGSPGFGVPGFNSPPFFTPAEPLNPFASHFTGDELVQIGPTGSLTLQLQRFVEIGPGLELGVFGNPALIADGDHQAGDPAGQFGNDNVVIEVSETGLPGQWAALNGNARVAIDTPVSFYADAGGLVSPTENVSDLLPLVSSLTPADFGQPFDNPTGVAAFDGLNVVQIESLFAGSAGGDWFDLDGLLVNGQPLERVGYVRFSDPEDPSLFGAANLFELMAVSINSELAGDFVPEPATVTSCLLMLFASAMLRKRNH